MLQIVNYVTTRIAAYKFDKVRKYSMKNDYKYILMCMCIYNNKNI